tara:strand:+ start:63 stop:254 length:192 start_codon:yes stop_codon:yes gene_type:complete
LELVCLIIRGLKLVVFNRLVGMIGLVALFAAVSGVLEKPWRLSQILVGTLEFVFSLVIHGTMC